MKNVKKVDEMYSQEISSYSGYNMTRNTSRSYYAPNGAIINRYNRYVTAAEFFILKSYV